MDRLEHETAIAYDTAAPRESLNYMGGYFGAMATNPFDDPQDMSPADLATAADPEHPHIDFTKN